MKLGTSALLFLSGASVVAAVYTRRSKARRLRDRQEAEDALKQSIIETALQTHGSVVSVEHDADILGATVGQTLLLIEQIPGISPSEREDIVRIINLLAYKLGAVRYHCKRYVDIRQKRYVEISENKRMLDLIKRGVTDCERDMDYEFEAWLHQVKSSLDILVQLFHPVLGSRRSEPWTYGRKGDDIITHLQQTKKHKKIVVQLNLDLWKIDGLIELIGNNRDAWIKSIVEWRDTISHRLPFIQIGFTWDTSAGQLKEPLAVEGNNKRPISEIMQQVSQILINYARDFIAFTLACRRPKDARLRPLTETERRYYAALWTSQGSEVDVEAARWRFNDAPEITEADLKAVLGA